MILFLELDSGISSTPDVINVYVATTVSWVRYWRVLHARCKNFVVM